MTGEHTDVVPTNVWAFKLTEEDEHAYQDGTIVPSLTFDILLNDRVVGEFNVHLHKRFGSKREDPRHLADLSVGTTVVAFGPLSNPDGTHPHG